MPSVLAAEQATALKTCCGLQLRPFLLHCSASRHAKTNPAYPDLKLGCPSWPNRILQTWKLTSTVLMQATRDYVVGQGIEPVVSEVATELGIALPLDFQSRKCKHEEDIVKFDLILVMDKFTASDFLKEVCGAGAC